MRAAGAAQHQLHLRRREREHRLCLQRPVPRRAPRLDWTQIQPGDRSDLIWHGYLPFDRVPQIWNPKSGFVFNSNNTPFQATGPEDALKPSDFRPTMGIQTNMTNRAYRAQETFGADPAITAEASAPTNSISPTASDPTCANDRRGCDMPIRDLTPICSAAQALLKGWDRRTNVATGRGAGSADGQRSCAFGQPSRRAAASTLCATPSQDSRPISAASIRSGARSTASAAANSI